MRSPSDTELWGPVVIVFALNWTVFVIAQLRKDNSIVDIFWGTLFFVPIWLVLGMNSNFEARPLIVAIIVTIWGLRLSIHIARRHNGEDYRYRDMRDRWNEIGTGYYYFATFVFIFSMQAAISLLNNSSALFVVIFSEGGVTFLDFIGLAVWLTGFFFEIVGDWQLQQFRDDPNRKPGTVIQSGLWKYTRHPNYFGEALLWWGIYLIACSVKYGAVTFYSALIITLLIRYVSGVPLLEKKYEENPNFQEYASRTNVFFPWCPRNQEGVTQHLLE